MKNALIRLRKSAFCARNNTLTIPNEDNNMDSYSWIMYAGMATWAGLGLYLCILARKQATLSRRISQMAGMMEDDA